MFLNNITPDKVLGIIPKLVFVAFQGVFATIAVAIISALVIGPIKFNSWIIFSALWVIFVYAPMARLIWG